MRMLSKTLAEELLKIARETGHSFEFVAILYDMYENLDDVRKLASEEDE